MSAAASRRGRSNARAYLALGAGGIIIGWLPRSDAQGVAGAASAHAVSGHDAGTN